MYQLLIKNAHCVNPEREFSADVAVADGKIARIAPGIDADANRVLEAGGKLLLPGVIDTHVHLPWPSASFDSVDDFASGTTAAVFGGVTTIIEYIVPDESGHILPFLDRELIKAGMTARCDYSFHFILRKVTAETLAEMEQAVARGITTFKIYTAYAGFRLEDEPILRALQKADQLGAMTCFHAEDGLLINFASAELEKAGQTAIRYYPLAHPRMADTSATRRVLDLAEYLGARVHIVHVNTADGAAMIGAAHKAGMRVTGETCPQYLGFTDAVYKSGKPEAANYILAPVIREQADQDALWAALVHDDLQTIATDHCPYSTAQKQKAGDDFRGVPGGAGGIETSLPFVFTHGVKAGKLALTRMVELMATNPAKLFNLYPQKGVIAEGSDADFALYDPAGETAFEAARLHGAGDHTILQGLPISGRLAATILRGEVVVEDGALAAQQPGGKFLPRQKYRE
ncbi:MAG: dihydropyrimidinase [Anaerolineae bacterium]|nr:dihydropyrimidinase [Anaerolineae bacterium]